MGGNNILEKIVVFVTLSIVFTIFFSAFIASVNNIDSSFTTCQSVPSGEASFIDCPEELCNTDFIINCIITNNNMEKKQTSSLGECNRLEM